jgi:glycosyltransferase involved in cell wall biosynthesis
LGRNKGIEVMLRALPSAVKADPSVLYIVLGATHPEVLRREGLSYKLELEKMARDLGVERNVVFHHRFAHKEELFQFLGAADIYVTPYLHKEQLTSGTLAFAVGTGRAVVSTPYWAAEELLAQGRGKLVRFGDSQQMALTIVALLAGNSEASRMRRRAYEYGRSMTWPSVGESYRRLFDAITQPERIPVTSAEPSEDWIAPASGEPQQLYQPA